METVAKLREMPHWSYSAMQCYLTCPLKYKFRYIDNAEPERTGSCFPFGRAFHAALSERARIGIDMSEREVCDVFEDFFKVECEAAQNLTYKQNEDYDTLLQTGFRMVEAACENWMDDYAVQSVAESFSVNVPGLSKPLIGEFDCVVTDGKDTCIVDWKSSSAKWRRARQTRTCRQLRSVTLSKRSMEKSRCSGSMLSPKPKRPPSTTIILCGRMMSLIALSLWQTALKRVSTAAVSIPMKQASAVANAPTLTVARSGGEVWDL